MNFDPYNPLDDANLQASVAEALLERDPIRLDKLPRFNGAGLYALYYTGPFPAYEPLAARNRDNRFEWPIYVGKAEENRTRIGAGPAAQKLFKRLCEHRESVNQAVNLDVTDFYCRALVVKDIWVPLGESLLLSKYAPLWNKTVDGFGNHNPGRGRVAGMMPRWDTLHPGRPWAPNHQPRNETAEQLITEIRHQLELAAVPAKPRFLAP